MAGNLARRVAFAAVAIPVVVVTAWYGGAALALLLALAGAAGARELQQFARQQGIRTLRPLTTLAAAGLPLLVWGVVRSPDVRAMVEAWWPYAAALWLLVILVGTLARRRPDQRPLAAAAVTLLVPAYAGGLLAFALPIRHAWHGVMSWEGVALLGFPLVTVWVCDTAAMGVGRQLGGPRLAPRVSPGKTWSGTAGGFVAALAVAPLYQMLVFRPLGIDAIAWHLLVIAGVIGVLGQAGDLVESLLKREVGFKDSSHLLPGHGGVLDRMDSLYFAIPLTAFLYRVAGLI
jgi:phosphatidate cytidylyltransferase